MHLAPACSSLGLNLGCLQLQKSQKIAEKKQQQVDKLRKIHTQTEHQKISLDLQAKQSLADKVRTCIPSECEHSNCTKCACCVAAQNLWRKSTVQREKHSSRKKSGQTWTRDQGMFLSRSSAFNIRYTLRIFRIRKTPTKSFWNAWRIFGEGTSPQSTCWCVLSYLNKFWWICMHTNSRMQRVLLDDKDREIEEAKKELEDAVTDTNIANEQLDEYMVSCLLPPLCTSRAQTHH